MIETYFAQQLKVRRGEAALTQQELANKLHVSRKTISSWETGRNRPDIDTLKQLATIFQISLDDLLGNASAVTVKAGSKATKYHHASATVMNALIAVIVVERITQLSTTQGLMWMNLLLLATIGLRVLISKYGQRLVKPQMVFMIAEMVIGAVALISGWLHAFHMGFGFYTTCCVVGWVMLIDVAIQLKRRVRNRSWSNDNETVSREK